MIPNIDRLRLADRFAARALERSAEVDEGQALRAVAASFNVAPATIAYHVQKSRRRLKSA